MKTHRSVSLPRFAMRRPVTVTMLALTVIGLGAIAVRRTAVEFMPPMDLPFLGAFVPYAGATPAQVEQEIAIPAEGEFQTLPNLRQLYTNSSSDGAFISLNFEWGTNMTEALADVRDRMERLRLVLPEDADRVFVRHFKLETFPVLSVGLSRAGDYDVFIDRVEEEVVPRIKRLEGVADVELLGYEPRSIMVDIDQQAMAANGLSLYELIARLNTADVDEGVGELYDGGQKYYVRAEDRMRGIQDYQNLVLSNGLRIQDVAQGGYRAREADFHFSIDGDRQVFLMITKDSEANTVATCRAVLAEIDALLDTPTLEGTDKHVFFNQGNIIEGALDGLKKSALGGGVMAVIVLFVFLRRLRATVIVALAIPGSLVCAFVYMYAAGMTLNLITMMSLIVAVGMVVDNAIVVIENIYRHHAMGKDMQAAARDGATEVSLAIVAATSTTAVVFLPVFYMESGQMSVFTRQFAIPVTVALAASLLIALTVIPLAVSRLKPRESSPMARYRGTGVAASGATVERLRRVYGSALRWAVSNRFATVVLLAGVVALTVAVPLRAIPYKAVPQVDGRTVEIDVELDPNFDMVMADELFGQVDALLNERRDELGIKHVFKNYTAAGGEIQAFLTAEEDLAPGENYPYTTEEVMNILWYLLPERAPGARFTVSTGGPERGGGSGESRVSLRLEGDDTATLDRYADSLMDILHTVPGLTDIRKSTARADQEIQLNVDNALSEHAGLDAMRIAQTVGFALRGVELSRIKQGGREISVWAQFKAEDRRGRANLDNIMLQGDRGGRVMLNQLVTTRKAQTPQVINRRNGKNFVYVTASTAEGNLAAMNSTMREIAAQFDMPLGYSVQLGDEFRTMREDQSNFASILILAVVLIFVVMAALFESPLLPLSILTSVPLAFFGVAWTVFAVNAAGYSVAMDTIAFIGCVLMVGVVVNNGIVIVDHITNLRRHGRPRLEAIVQAGRDRLRPVVMTALTTILGAMPLVAPVVFPRVGNPATVSLGCALIGGLAAGTLLTLFVVPLFYTFVDDFQLWLKRYAGAVLALRRGDSMPAG